MRKYLTISLQLVVLGLILYWISQSLDRNHWNTLVQQKKDWNLLAVSLGIVLAANVISFLRWYVFVHALQVPFTMIEAIRLGFLGNLFNLVSFGAVGGDVFRAIAAAMKAGKKRPEVVASVLVDRALGLLGLVIVAAVSLQSFGGTLSPNMEWIRRGAWIASAIGIACLTLIAFAGHHLPMQLLQRIPGIGNTLFRMASAAMLFEGRPFLVVILIGMSCFIHSILTIAVYLISVSLYSYAGSPTLPEHFLTVPTSFAAAALPLTPGGIGVQEMAVINLFKELPSLPASYSALIVALVYRLQGIVVAVIGGIYYFFGSKEIKKIQDEATHAE